MNLRLVSLFINLKLGFVLLFVPFPAHGEIVGNIDQMMTIREVYNPSTGYSWDLKTCQEYVVDETTEPLEPPKPMMTGGMYWHTWHLRFSEPGRYTCMLTYDPPGRARMPLKSTEYVFEITK